MKTLSFCLALTIFLSLAACCHCKKSQKDPAAKDVLKDRNTIDPKIDSLKKPVEKVNPNLKFE